MVNVRPSRVGGSNDKGAENALDKDGRKKLQNRIAQRKYRQTQKQKVQALEAAALWVPGLDNLLPSNDSAPIPSTSSTIAPSATDVAALDQWSWHKTHPLSVTVAGFGDGRTPLHIAACTENIELSKLLIESGADIDVQDANLKTPLHLAAENGYGDVAELLLHKAADPSKLDYMGRTALFSAVESGNETLVRLILKSAVDVDAMDATGCSALHLAVAGNFKEITELLLGAGADVNAQAQK